MEELNKKVYRCSCCGTEYPTKKQAGECEHYGEIVRRLREKILPRKLYYLPFPERNVWYVTRIEVNENRTCSMPTQAARTLFHDDCAMRYFGAREITSESFFSEIRELTPDEAVKLGYIPFYNSLDERDVCLKKWMKSKLLSMKPLDVLNYFLAPQHHLDALTPEAIIRAFGK